MFTEQVSRNVNYESPRYVIFFHRSVLHLAVQFMFSALFRDTPCLSTSLMLTRFDTIVKRSEKLQFFILFMFLDIQIRDSTRKDSWQNIPVIKQTKCTILRFILGIKLYMFQTVHLSIRRFLLYTQQWYLSQSLQAVSKTYMTYIIAVCSVKNS